MKRANCDNSTVAVEEWRAWAAVRLITPSGPLSVPAEGTKIPIIIRKIARFILRFSPLPLSFFLFDRSEIN